MKENHVIRNVYLYFWLELEHLFSQILVPFLNFKNGTSNNCNVVNLDIIDYDEYFLPFLMSMSIKPCRSLSVC